MPSWNPSSPRDRRRAARRLEPAPAPTLDGPVGPFPDAEAASDALLAAMLSEGGSWGEPMLQRWARAERVPEAAAVPLAQMLAAEGYLVAGDGPSPRWRAKRAA